MPPLYTTAYNANTNLRINRFPSNISHNNFMWTRANPQVLPLQTFQSLIANCASLAFNAACSGNSLTTFREHLSVPSSRARIQIRTDRLFRKDGKELPLHAALKARKAQFPLTSRRKPETRFSHSFFIRPPTWQQTQRQLTSQYSGTTVGIPWIVQVYFVVFRSLRIMK